MHPAVGVQRNRVDDVEVVGGLRTDGLRRDLDGVVVAQSIIVNDEPRAAGLRAILTRAGAQELGMSLVCKRRSIQTTVANRQNPAFHNPVGVVKIPLGQGGNGVASIDGASNPLAVGVGVAVTEEGTLRADVAGGTERAARPDG